MLPSHTVSNIQSSYRHIFKLAPVFWLIKESTNEQSVHIGTCKLLLYVKIILCMLKLVMGNYYPDLFSENPQHVYREASSIVVRGTYSWVSVDGCVSSLGSLGFVYLVDGRIAY